MVIKYKSQARNALAKGMDQVAEMVKVTFGPLGHSMVISQPIGGPLITKDGVTVALNINLADPHENMGARLCREVASQTNTLVGDGTTTSIILMQAITRAGLPLVEAGVDPLCLRRGLQHGVAAVTAEICQLSTAASYSQIEQIATVAAKSAHIGALIGKGMQKTGNGMIAVQETIEGNTYLQITEGMELPNGYLSPYFSHDKEQMRIKLDNPYILITDEAIHHFEQIHRILNWCAWEKRPLLIVAAQVEKDVLGKLITYNQQQKGRAIAVQAPGPEPYQLGYLQDLAVVTGGTPIAGILGLSLENADKTKLGQAQKVLSEQERTTIIGGKGQRESVDEQVCMLKALEGQSADAQERGKLQQRISHLAGHMAVIRVGADTKMAQKELKDRVIDGVQSAKAASELGVVPGGGLAFLQAAQVLQTMQLDVMDEQAGVEMLQKALESPLRQIVENSGRSSGKVIGSIREKKYELGFDVVSGHYVDMIEEGIIDATKVLTTALSKAASIASILLMTEGLVKN